MEPGKDLADDAWLRFLRDAVAGLREAGRRIEGSDRKAVLQRRPGWFGAAPKGRRGARVPNETSISEALIRELRRMRADQFIGAPLPGDPYPNLTGMDFNVEVEREFDDAMGPNAKRTDIQIAIHGDRIDFRIEAKKLMAENDIAAEYLGERGLGRFDDVRSPYSLRPYAGMLAYVFDRDAVTWSGWIDAALRGSMPAVRMATTDVGGEVMLTTVHVRDVDLVDHGIKGRFRTDVIHLLMDLASHLSPPRRLRDEASG